MDDPVAARETASDGREILYAYSILYPPFCRTGSFNGSRWLIWNIYRWYKIMSPRIEMNIESIAYDAKSLRLYVTMHQIFRIWAIPFFNAPVTLTTVLQLVTKPYPTPHHPNKRDLYFIQSQNDLYQVNEWIKFVSQFGILSLFVFLWQLVATALCVLGAFAFWPVSWLEQNVIGGNRERGFGEAVKG
ncbi:hypothetical protein G7Y79_00023g053220 [Physcia stellaris]|nr:hypothetical protein G7Y79_00023g053220 [Physcia stellaris]